MVPRVLFAPARRPKPIQTRCQLDSTHRNASMPMRVPTHSTVNPVLSIADARWRNFWDHKNVAGHDGETSPSRRGLGDDDRAAGRRHTHTLSLPPPRIAHASTYAYFYPAKHNTATCDCFNGVLHASHRHLVTKTKRCRSARAPFRAPAEVAAPRPEPNLLRLAAPARSSPVRHSPLDVCPRPSCPHASDACHA